MYRVKTFLYLSGVLITLFSCTGNKPSTDEKSGVEQKNNSAANDPMIADSITPSSVKDTQMLSEYGKDSLKMSAAFQRAANGMARSLKAHDALAYTAYTPPTILQKFGGKERFVQSLRSNFEAEKRQVERVVAGPIKNIAAALDDQGYEHGWYCLMPVRQFLNEDGKKVMEMQWFGGQSLNGKDFYFINITDIPREHILQIMPDLRYVLDPETGNNVQ